MPLLTNDLEDHEPSDENVSRLLILLLTESITYTNSIESMISAIDIIDDDLNDKPNSKTMVASIDFEWPIYDFGRIKGNIRVAQIGANLSNNKRHHLVLPFGHHPNNQQFLIRLQQFLAKFYVVFIVRMIANAIAKIKK